MVHGAEAQCSGGVWLTKGAAIAAAEPIAAERSTVRGVECGRKRAEGLMASLHGSLVLVTIKSVDKSPKIVGSEEEEIENYDNIDTGT
jgi:hypothetical protein